MSDKFVGFVSLRHTVLLVYCMNIFKLFFYHATKKKEEQGVGAHCSLLLKYLHPKQKIDEVIPLNARRNKQELDECVVVS
jgi:hypothetical protein